MPENPRPNLSPDNAGDALDVRDWHGRPVTDDSFLMLFNASHEDVDLGLPDHAARRWVVVIDTTDERGFLDPQPTRDAGHALALCGRSFALLRRG